MNLNILKDFFNSVANKIKKYSLAEAPSVFVHKSAEIDPNVVIGSGTKIWHFSHIISNSRIGMNVSIGQGCMIGPNVIVGSGVKVQNNVSLYDGLIVEDNVFFGPSAVLTNVKNPRSAVNRKDNFQKTIVREGATIGANSTIVCGVEIGRNAFIAAGAVVTSSVEANALYAGVPARKIGWVSNSGEVLNENLYCEREDAYYFLASDGMVKKKPTKKIALLTHDTSDNKTQFIAANLHAMGYTFDVFTNDHEPLLAPENIINETSPSWQWSSKIFNAIEWGDRGVNYDYLLVCGPGIIKDQSYFKGNILNSHTSLILGSNELDAFQTSIMHMEKIGCTLHFINQDKDASEAIKSRETYLLKSDTLQDFKNRHFKNEVELLCDFEFHLEHKNTISLSTQPSNNKIKEKFESDLNKQFEDYKRKYAV
jgi:UDP-2-acetamido-3-amino-2,3-dideoxy-glucuronate N-acetyltransferase